MICILGSLELPVLCLVFMAQPFPYLVPLPGWVWNSASNPTAADQPKRLLFLRNFLALCAGSQPSLSDLETSAWLPRAFAGKVCTQYPCRLSASFQKRRGTEGELVTPIESLGILTEGGQQVRGPGRRGLFSSQRSRLSTEQDQLFLKVRERSTSHVSI